MTATTIMAGIEINAIFLTPKPLFSVEVEISSFFLFVNIFTISNIMIIGITILDILFKINIFVVTIYISSFLIIYFIRLNYLYYTIHALFNQVLFIIIKVLFSYLKLLFCVKFFMGDNMKENKENTLKVIGQNIKQIRLLKNLTQEELAEKLDKSINFISLIERGESGISISTIIDICNALQINSDELFNGLIDKQVVTDDEFITNSLNMFNREDKKIVKGLIEYIINSKK